MFHVLFNQLCVQHSACKIFDPWKLDMCSKLPTTFALLSLQVHTQLRSLYPPLYLWCCSCEKAFRGLSLKSWLISLSQCSFSSTNFFNILLKTSSNNYKHLAILCSDASQISSGSVGSVWMTLRWSRFKSQLDLSAFFSTKKTYKKQGTHLLLFERSVL